MLNSREIEGYQAALERLYNKQIRRVHQYARLIAEGAGLHPADREALDTAAQIYDIGMTAVPEPVLTQPGKLTVEEFEQVKANVRLTLSRLEAAGYPVAILRAVAGHHERCDGNGYPAGLTGEQIPISSRVLALADSYEALTSDRPFRPRMTEAEAMGFIAGQAGSKYDPELVKALQGVVE